LLVADDASSDQTMAIVCDFAKSTHFPVRIFQNPARIGYRANFMKAAECCRGDLVAFCDQDDIWHPEKLSRMAHAFDNAQVLLAYHNSTLIDGSGHAIGAAFRSRRTTVRFVPLALPPWTIVPGHAQIVRRSLIRLTALQAISIDPYCPGERMPHDQWYPFWASVLGNIVYVGEPLAQYRQHDANVSGWNHTSWLAYALDHIANAEAYARSDSIGAANRLGLLQRCDSPLTSEEHARIRAAISYYEALVERTTQRLSIYDGRCFHERARHLLAFLWNGGYARRAPGALGLDALTLDAFIGVPSKRLGRHR
jgi:glycosyltransferase involved in cell wall biosynthesis